MLKYEETGNFYFSLDPNYLHSLVWFPIFFQYEKQNRIVGYYGRILISFLKPINQKLVLVILVEGQADRQTDRRTNR